MEKSGVKEIIFGIIADHFDFAEPGDLCLEQSLRYDLYADELDLTEICMELEDEFDLRITDSDFEPLKTISDIVEYIYSEVKNGFLRRFCNST